MQHPSRSASGDLAAALPQADEVAWLPVMQRPSRGQLFETNVRLAAANDLKIAVSDRRRTADDDGLAVDDPSLDRAVNSGDGGLDQLFGAPKQAVAAAAGGAPNNPTFDMRTPKPRSDLNSDVSPRSPAGSPRGSFLVGEAEESVLPGLSAVSGDHAGGKSPMISPSSTLSKGGSSAAAAAATAAPAAAAFALPPPRFCAPAAAATAAPAAATAAARNPGAGLQLTAAQLRGSQGATSPRSSPRSSPRGPSTPKGWPPGKGPPAKAPPPGLPPAIEGRKSNATQAKHACISPRSQDGEQGDGKLSGSVVFSSASPSASRAEPDPGAAQQSSPGPPRPPFPSPPKMPSGQFSVPPVSLVQNAARTSQQMPSSRSSFDALTTPASQTFAAAAAALRLQEEEAKLQALLRRKERLERAKSENDRRREAGSVRRESDGPSRSDDARHESPAHQSEV